MQGAYAYVKEKSKWIGPNMSCVSSPATSVASVADLPFSLIYQLLEYERTLKPEHDESPRSQISLTNTDDEEEWGRRRCMLDEPSSEAENDDRENAEVMREARALDKAMEDRIVARKSSASSIASSSGIGMGAAWRSRYGARKRTGSIASNTTNGSIISENLLEEEEEELLGVGGWFDDRSPRQTSSSEPDASSATTSPESPSEEKPVFVSPVPQAENTTQSSIPSLVESRPPPSAPVGKTSFGIPPPPAAAIKPSFDLPSQPPSKLQSKRRPAPLGITPPALSSQVAIVVTPVVPIQAPRPRTQSRQPPPPPLHLRKSPRTPQPAPARPIPLVAASTLSQTLFVFPPSPTLGTRTPATMTLTSNLRSPLPFPSMSTPRVSTFRSGGRTRSFIGLGAAPTPTTACSRVDVRGWIGLDLT
jgi:tyrosine-protein phosphatase